MLRFKNSNWRFDSPGIISGEAVAEFSRLIGQIANQADAQAILEHFKSYFASAAGIASTMWSTSVSWAEADLQNYMEQAAANAPLFIEAFCDGCESLREKDLAIPDVAVMNRILTKHETGYEIRPPDLISHDAADGPVEVPDAPPSLDEAAREIIQKSLSQSEQFLSAGQKDEVVAIKRGPYEEHIGKSERLFLSVWRAHFNGWRDPGGHMLMYSLDSRNRQKMLWLLATLVDFDVR